MWRLGFGVDFLVDGLDSLQLLVAGILVGNHVGRPFRSITLVTNFVVYTIHIEISLPLIIIHFCSIDMIYNDKQFSLDLFYTISLEILFSPVFE